MSLFNYVSPLTKLGIAFVMIWGVGLPTNANTKGLVCYIRYMISLNRDEQPQE